MKRLSIVVPVYNVEPYLERCLRSLEDQDISSDEYEIICINDGSLDKSCEIIIRLKKEFDNIILIDQKNQGVSSARNNGLKLAKGKYILCVDPDDYIEKNSLKRGLNKIEYYNTQLLYLGFTILNKDGSIRKQIKNWDTSNKVFTGIETSLIARSNRRYDPDRIWGILYNSDFLKKYNLRFLPNVPFAEDGEFITRTLCVAEKCTFDDYLLYNRTNRDGSATNSKLMYTEKATKGFVLIANNLKKFQQLHNLTDTQKVFLEQPICRYVIKAVYSASLPFKLKKINDLKTILNEFGFNKVNLTSNCKPYIIDGFIYNRSIYLLILYHFLKGKFNSLNSNIKRIFN